MLISPYNPYDRYKRRSAERVTAVLVMIIILGIVAGVGFLIGGQYAQQRIASLESQLAEQVAQGQQVQDTLTELSAEAKTAIMRYDQLQQTYQETIPEGPMQSLVLLIKKQLDEGMDPQRLEFLIRSARPPRNCSEPETKRFVISTPANAAPASEVGLADGAIVIRGSGISARNDKGAPEAWYDSSKSVEVEFVLKEEPGAEPKIEKKTGVMPIQHSVVLGGREYRMTLEESARSFAKVTYDSCDYP